MNNFYFKNSINFILKKRIFSFLIDIAIIQYLNYGLILSYKNFIKNYFILPLKISQEISNNLKTLDLITFPFLFLTYFSVLYFLGNGQTIGKFLLNLKVTVPNNKKLKFFSCFMRSLGTFFCYFSGIFLFLIPFITINSKGIQDWISGTEVKDKNSLKVIEDQKQLELFKSKKAS
jgi:uncharacterized RDD family membrane protein YckC